MTTSKEYLTKHEIPRLFDEISKKLLKAKPDDPIPFILQVLSEKKAERDSNAGKK
jgi:hypothetical protein|eukprot:CAMPEP_0174291102 /NCGR_PEP_ID=MMETSP0809-20121228/31049_1 /TAXON_ID=73025 ORGANISM="Eutreptiella gymnastica-like, Strain CCMP1594" /NCGR_SAMPLE_ID=MMETSP0809 /ASSEMBLY_ACC=CAM_ASM_000658 /LENGTH=54 /DNA_ID=CAMNT_0015390237 /DNA_START=41 /DNA_END=205 /DNA_ORIENTATION=+